MIATGARATEKKLGNGAGSGFWGIKETRRCPICGATDVRWYPKIRGEHSAGAALALYAQMTRSVAR